MGKRRILDHTGAVVSTLEYDEMTDQSLLSVLQTPQSLDAILEENKQANANGAGWNKARDMKWLGRVPVGVAMQLAQEAGISPRAFWAMHPRERNDFLLRKMKDPDYRGFRIGA